MPVSLNQSFSWPLSRVDLLLAAEEPDKAEAHEIDFQMFGSFFAGDDAVFIKR